MPSGFSDERVERPGPRADDGCPSTRACTGWRARPSPGVATYSAACLGCGPSAPARRTSRPPRSGRCPPVGTTSVEITCPRWQRARHARPRGPRDASQSKRSDRDVRRRHAVYLDMLARSSTSRRTAESRHARCSTSTQRYVAGSYLARRASTARAHALRPRAAPGAAIDFAPRSKLEPACRRCPRASPERLLGRHARPPVVFRTPVHQFVVRDAGRRGSSLVSISPIPSAMVVIEYDSFEHHTGTAAHVPRQRSPQRDLGRRATPFSSATAR